MDDKGGFRIVGKAGKAGRGPEQEPELGATGFYYVTPTDAWDETSLAGRRSWAPLITLPIYIWRELLKGVALSVAVFSLILMSVFAGQVMRDGIGAYTLAKVLPNFLPLICPFVLPLAIITGILICYSRLSKDNEILAAFAGGINPLWLIFPALLTSVIAIFITLTLNEVALMPAIKNIERLVTEDQSNILRRMISRPGNITLPTGDEFIAMSKMDPASHPDGKAALDITRFTVSPESGKWNPAYPFPAKRVMARHHVIQEFAETSETEQVLKMSVDKPVFQELNKDDINRTFIADGESGEERIMLSGRPSSTIHSNRASFWPILMLSETRREAEERIRELESGASRIDELPASQRAAASNMLLRLKRVVQNRTSEINMRLALCFSCLAFAILGIPLGMRTRGTMMGSFVTGIGMSGVFFLALKSAEMQVAKGILSYWVIWMPDVLMVMLGVFLWMMNARRA